MPQEPPAQAGQGGKHPRELLELFRTLLCPRTGRRLRLTKGSVTSVMEEAQKADFFKISHIRTQDLFFKLKRCICLRVCDREKYFSVFLQAFPALWKVREQGRDDLSSAHSRQGSFQQNLESVSSDVPLISWSISAFTMKTSSLRKCFSSLPSEEVSNDEGKACSATTFK